GHVLSKTALRRNQLARFKGTPKHPTCRGFTLVEAMITVSIIGILAGYAVPNFRLWLKELRMDEAVSVLHASVLRARAEAQRTNSRVSLCRTGDIYASDPDCNANITGTSTPVADQDWSYGWLIYTTTDIAVDYDPSLGHELIAAVDTGTSDKNVVVNSSADVPTHFTYGANGRISTGNPVYAICDDRNGGEHGFRLTFSATGRPLIEQFANLAGADRNCTP
ncbi:MAG: GspH/FimT family pseudopilin, partial [bacterium]